MTQNRQTPNLLASARRKKGAALVLVLLLLTVLSIIVAEFVYEMRVQGQLMRNHEDQGAGLYVAKAGQNAAGGLLRHVSPESELFNNELIQLFQYSCLTPVDATQKDADEKKLKEQEGMGTAEGCGTWSLSIPYVLVDTPIDLNVYDEQAKLNLNALIKRLNTDPQNPDDATFTRNDILFNVVLELFLLQIDRRNTDENKENDIELSAADVAYMLELLIDYMDYGGFDDDKVSSFEYEDEDTIIPLKNGPLDTVDEIRYLPGMTDELYNAVAPFLTVYPASEVNSAFYDRVNINAAPAEVLYALFRGTSYNGVQPQLGVSEAWDLAVQTISGAYFTAQTGAQPQTPSPISIPKYQRQLPSQGQGSMLQNLVMDTNQKFRFYRVESKATSADGVETSITRVLKYDKNRNSLTCLYYREN